MRKVTLLMLLVIASTSAVAQGVAVPNNDLDNFVRKSKESLTRNYLDPFAAQFTNLVVVEEPKDKLRHLCGWVNGKNAYGGYIGALMFTVTWSESEPSQPKIVTIWTEGDQLRKATEELRTSSAPRNSEADMHHQRAVMYGDLAAKAQALYICIEDYSEYENYIKEAGIELTQDEINQEKIDFDIQRNNRKYIRVR